MPNPHEQNHKVWQQNPLQDVKLLVQSTCSGSYPERDMGSRKAIAGGELCVIQPAKLIIKKTKL